MPLGSVRFVALLLDYWVLSHLGLPALHVLILHKVLQLSKAWQLKTSTFLPHNKSSASKNRRAISSSLLRLNHIWSQSIPKLSWDKTWSIVGKLDVFCHGESQLLRWMPSVQPFAFCEAPGIKLWWNYDKTWLSKKCPASNKLPGWERYQGSMKLDARPNPGGDFSWFSWQAQSAVVLAHNFKSPRFWLFSPALLWDAWLFEPFWLQLSRLGFQTICHSLMQKLAWNWAVNPSTCRASFQVSLPSGMRRNQMDWNWSSGKIGTSVWPCWIAILTQMNQYQSDISPTCW